MPRRRLSLGRTETTGEACTSTTVEGVRIRRCEGAGGVTYTAIQGGDVVGTLLLDYPSRRHAVVSLVEVNPRVRKQRVGTALYEAALQDACATNRKLTSDEVRSRFAEAFWQKQLKKGRVACDHSGARSFEYRMPWNEYVESHSPEEVAAMDAKLPRSIEHEWRCNRYVMKSGPCKSGKFDLSGLGGTRRKAKRRRKRPHVWGLSGAGWNAKDERQYQHIVDSCMKTRRSKKTCKRIAAATVNRQRSKEGRTKR